jgi:hypothetical protein
MGATLDVVERGRRIALARRAADVFDVDEPAGRVP